MSFEKYQSIENSYREKFIEIIKNTPAVNDIWYVSEKIHGSNFAVIYHNGSVSYAKRGGLLEENENFYNHKDVFKDLEPKIIDAFSSMSKSVAKNSILTYYGEIFGPGVQKGVNYGEKSFRFFDVKIEVEGNSFFVDQYVLHTYEIEDVLTLAPQLGNGSFDEVLNFNCEFDSKILNIKDNPAEGIVLKPNKAAFLPETGTRIILKKKHPKFSEIAHVGKNPVVKIELSEDITKYITKNRLDNVFSKIEPSFKNFQAINKEFFKDVLDEVEKDGTITEQEQVILSKECSNFIREKLKCLV